ncbi:Lsr2 family protein [Paenarthrobacter sp. Z7-10]|uniref:histone-like nucleoid-structuring protein Lsr2 n=1 Tax=Paenarthrobacter sp. Z7-10 TaxID=2787635 RepID=UPI0022A9BB38|nr:Lsr2 family protein [Paenarthrobacter sp. Z7-10]MCZ2401962.1 Lsr2 family protein [Paenarthrobacter sp. Z7-10]
MAQTVKIILEDDLDGGPAEETIRFALDGVNYEIDLSEGNSTALRNAFGPYVAKARRVTGRAAKNRPAAAAASRSQEVGQIRSWARENGYQVRERGRIQAEIQEAYYRAKA